MSTIKTWLKAIRPRTLLLSASGILMGCFLAVEHGYSRFSVFAFALLTALCLQILSNLANDYGDFKTGVDNQDRIGPQRGVQSGEITERQMKLAITVTVMLSCICGCLLIFVFARLTWSELFVFAFLGIAAVVAAIFYTLGGHPYGYRGLGDLYCFLFFGIVSVSGSYYLAAHTFDWSILLPASAIGLFSNAVLNINNMRDYENDKANSKRTVVVKMGIKATRAYHALLLFVPFLCLSLYNILSGQKLITYLFWVYFPFFASDYYHIINTTDLSKLDPFLKKQVIKTFLLVLTYGLLLMC